MWNAATKNTFADGETVIKSLSSVLAEMLEYVDYEESDFSIPSMYVITNKSKIKGSVQLLDKESIRNFFPDYIHRLVCIPSSIHEFIIIPFEDENEISIEDFNNIIQEVNSTEVDATEQLGSHIYILSI